MVNGQGSRVKGLGEKGCENGSWREFSLDVFVLIFILIFIALHPCHDLCLDPGRNDGIRLNDDGRDHDEDQDEDKDGSRL